MGRPDRLVHVRYESQYVGPLPPPQLLRAYAELLPDIPDRMMRIAERLQADDHAKQMVVLDRETAEMHRNWDVVGRGQWLGFGICMGCIAGAVLSVWLAPTAVGATVGSLLGGGGLATLAWAFRYDRTTPPAGAEPKPRPGGRPET